MELQLNSTESARVQIIPPAWFSRCSPGLIPGPPWFPTPPEQCGSSRTGCQVAGWRTAAEWLILLNFVDTPPIWSKKTAGEVREDATFTDTNGLLRGGKMMIIITAQRNLISACLRKREGRRSRLETWFTNQLLRAEAESRSTGSNQARWVYTPH